MHTSFRLIPAIENSLRFLLTRPLDIILSGGAAAIVLAVTYLILYYLYNDFGAQFLFSVLLQEPSMFALFMMIVLFVASILLFVAFHAYLVIVFYKLAYTMDGDRTLPAHADGAEKLMVQTAMRRIWRLWPFLPAIVLLAVSELLGFFGEVQSMAEGDDSLLWFANFLWLIGVLSYLGGLWSLVRNFLFMAPVIVETGGVDQRAIKAMVPGIFPMGLASAAFLKAIAVVLVAEIPLWFVDWAIDQILGPADPSASADASTAYLFFSSLIGLAAIVLTSAVVAGALAHIWRERRAEPAAG